MKNIPDRIYLQIGDNTPKSADFEDLDEVTWCADRISENDIEYIRVKNTDLQNTNKQTIMENNKNTTELTPLMAAEQEMKEKAIEAHRKLCPYLDDEICAGQSDVVTSSKIDEKCMGKCEYMEFFKSLINKKQ